MFSVIKNGDRENYGVNYYIVDEYDELDNIPSAAPGSKAYVIEKKKNYIKSANENWEEYVSAVGGGVGDAVHFIGITTQLPTGSEVTLTDGSKVQAEQGDIIFVDTDSTDDETTEYIWNGKSWQWLDGGSGEVFSKVKVNGEFVSEFDADTKLSFPSGEQPNTNVVYGYKSNEDEFVWFKVDSTSEGAQTGRIPLFHAPVVGNDSSAPPATIYVATPKGKYEAANKQYVDETLQTIVQVYIGNTEPTNTNTILWIDTNDNN